MQKNAKFDTWKSISGDCVRCGRCWSFEGWDNGEQYLLLKRSRAARICKLCTDAQENGEYCFPCDGCALLVRGSFEEVRGLINVFGRAFCQECRVGFLGRYDPENPALCDVLAAQVARVKRSRRRAPGYPNDRQLLYQQQ